MPEKLRDCDRCDATIVEWHFGRPTVFNVVVDISDPSSHETVYEETQKILCRKCEREFVTEFCDGDDIPDRADRIDLPATVTAAEDITRTARTLLTLADVMRDSLNESESDTEMEMDTGSETQ